jgi:hypothetical protein
MNIEVRQNDAPALVVTGMRRNRMQTATAV